MSAGPEIAPDQSGRTTLNMRKAMLAIVAAIFPLATACGSSHSGSGATSGTPKSGGTFTMAIPNDPVCLDPQQSNAVEVLWAGRQVFDTLTDQDPKTGVLVPWLATSWTVNSIATSFDFTLRTGVTFSDGTPLTAAVVKQNFDSIEQNSALFSSASSFLTGYSGTTVNSPTSLTVQFKSPNAAFLQATSQTQLAIEAPATLALAPSARCTAPPVGSGPFIYGDYKPNVSLTLNRRSGYNWPSALHKSHTGNAYVKTISFPIISQASVAAGSLVSGKISGIGEVAPQTYSTLQNAKVNLEDFSYPGIPYNLMTNRVTSRPIVDDPVVAQAVQQAINRDQLVSTVYPGGFATAATSILTPNTPGYVNLSSQITYSPDAAKQALSSDGWNPGADGIRTKNGQPLNLVIEWGGTATDQSSLELVQQELKAVGINATLSQYGGSGAAAAKIFLQGNWDFFYFSLSRADADVLRKEYFDFSKPQPAADSPSGTLNKILIGILATGDVTQRQQLVAKAQQSIISNGFAVPLVNENLVGAFGPKVQGVEFTSGGGYEFYDTWIK